MKTSPLLAVMTTVLLLTGCQNAPEPKQIPPSKINNRAPSPTEINHESEITLKTSVIDVKLNQAGAQNIEWASAISSNAGAVRKIATSMGQDISVIAVDNAYLQQHLSKDLGLQGELTTHTGFSLYTVENIQTPIYAASYSNDLVARECTETHKRLSGKQTENSLLVDTITTIASPTAITINSKVSAVTRFPNDIDCDMAHTWYSDGNALFSSAKLGKGESLVVAAVVNQEAGSPKPKVVTVMIITPYIKQ